MQRYSSSAGSRLSMRVTPRAGRPASLGGTQAALAAVALVLWTQGAAAQAGRLIDVGSFTITVDGKTVARETFRMSASRADQSLYVLTSDVTAGDRRIDARLDTDGTGAAIFYQVRVRVGNSEESWRGEIARGRLNARIANDRGTSARESMVPAGVLIIDEDVVAQHWALGLRERTAPVPVLVPRRNNAVVALSVSAVGEERLRIGTEDLQSTHYRAAADGGDIRDVWVDRAGRLLKVSIPSRSLVAVRDDPPMKE